MEDKNESLMVKLKPRQGLNQQLEKSNILPYNSINTVYIGNYINDMFELSSSNNSDPLWLEYKENKYKYIGVMPTESYRMTMLDMSRMSTIEYKDDK